MRPLGLETKIYLDSGSSEETGDIKERLGFLDGQTTNPTYFAKKNPSVRERVERGEKFTRKELLEEYRKLAQKISSVVPDGSVSIEVYADHNSTSRDLIDQAREMFEWIPNAHIKLPVIPAGLEAAELLVKTGVRVNMTLCFSQSQAAAVHAATRGAAPGQVYVSPFMSRLDKKGKNGFQLLENIQVMYRTADSHVEILAASVHSVFDIANIIANRLDIVTVPYDDMLEWIDAGMPMATQGLEQKDFSELEDIPFEELDLTAEWREFFISHPLTDSGLEEFASDWNDVLAE